MIKRQTNRSEPGILKMGFIHGTPKLIPMLYDMCNNFYAQRKVLDTLKYKWSKTEP